MEEVKLKTNDTICIKIPNYKDEEEIREIMKDTGIPEELIREFDSEELHEWYTLNNKLDSLRNLIEKKRKKIRKLEQEKMEEIE